MRQLFTGWFLFCFAFPALGAQARLKPELMRLMPKDYDINSPEFEDQRLRLEEHVSNCGLGVIQGALSRDGKPLKNRCTYQVAMDELFFTPQENLTGLINDPEWPYAEGVTFYEPSEKALEEVPENFDLRDLMKNGMPEIRTQKCGDCWAWASHHGLEIARAVHEQKATDHSIQTILSCSRQGTCNGGYMSAVDFLKHGLPYEVDFPYAASDKKCKYTTSEINTGWDAKVIGTPNIGSSLTYSLAKRRKDGSFREGGKVRNIMAAIHQWKSPVVVTVAAYDISGAGVYNSCSAINSGGNHMVTVVGWDTANGKRNAHVWNSWGQSHGSKGVSRIAWECGDGKLNRGLGVSAKIVQYKTPEAPCIPPDATQPYLKEILIGQSASIGATQAADTTCTWTPTVGLSDPTSCTPTASPTASTEYHLSAKNNCGTSSSMTLVDVWDVKRGSKPKTTKVRTPFGLVTYTRR